MCTASMTLCRWCAHGTCNPGADQHRETVEAVHLLSPGEVVAIQKGGRLLVFIMMH